MKLSKKEAIRIITDECKNYDAFLNDRVFLIIYAEHEITRYVEVGFRESQYLHLTGVTTILSARRFYEKCISGKLAENDFEIDNRGKVEQKLRVLPYLHDIFYNNCMIGDFLNSGIMIKADYFVGDTKFVLSVGFRYGKKVDIPVTLYSGDIRKLTNPTNKVLAIFKRVYPSKTYDEITYQSKNFDISKLETARKLISPPLLGDSRIPSNEDEENGTTTTTNEM